MRSRKMIRVALSALVVPAMMLCFSASALAAEEPVTREAKSITGTSALLHGELNPRAVAAEPVEYYFTYRASGSNCRRENENHELENEKVAPEPSELAAGTPKQAVSLNVTDLEPGTQYTVCLVEAPVGEPGSVSVGNPFMFTTHTLAPEVISEGSSGVTPFEAHLEAQVNANKQTTSCVFEYGTSTAYGNKTPCEQATIEGSGNRTSA